jgi:hypothetical protein
VAGTIYEAIHYAVFSNILFLLAIKFYALLNTLPKPSLQIFLNVPDQVSHLQLWKYYTQFLHFNRHAFRKLEGEQNVTKLYEWAQLQINFLSIFWSRNLYSFMPLQNTSGFPTFQNFEQCINSVMFFLWCYIPVVTIKFIIRIRNVARQCTTSL